MSVKNNKSSRSRAPNFTREDQTLLFRAMESYTHIIENKKTDQIRQCEKTAAWRKVAEVFNSNTTGIPRTVENLIGCYRNVKSKIKKDHSEAKMFLVGTSKKQALIDAIDENGKDWQKVASAISSEPEVCNEAYQQLEKQHRREVNKNKKSIMGTGGGPPEIETKSADFSHIMKIIEPQIDGLYTLYDSDAKLMSEFQVTLPEEERTHPIEMSQKPTPSTFETPPHGLSRTEILRKKKEPALLHNEYSKKKQNLNESFKQLAKAKLELVQLQKKCAEVDLEIKQIQLGETIKQNEFNALLREKQLLLLNSKNPQ